MDFVTQPLQEAILQDSLVKFLGDVICEIEEKTKKVTIQKETILIHFSEVLSHLLKCFPLTVIWEQGKSSMCLYIKNKREKPISIKEKESLSFNECRDFPPIKIEKYKDDGKTQALAISIAGTNDSGKIIIRIGGKISNYWEWFCNSIPANKSSFLTLLTLLKIQEEKDKVYLANLNEIALAIKTLLQSSKSNLSHWLEQAAKIISSAINIGDAQIFFQLEEVFIEILLEILSRGWGIIDGQTPLKDRVSKSNNAFIYVSKLLKQILDIILSQTSTNSKSGYSVPDNLKNPQKDIHCLGYRLNSINKCFKALLGDHYKNEEFDRFRDSANHTERLIELLAIWTGIHEELRLLLKQPIEIKWKNAVKIKYINREKAVKYTINTINQYLMTQFDTGNSQTERSPFFFQNGIYLWFLLQVLHEPGLENLLPNERVKFQADLALAMCECLRFACYGSRPHYRFQFATFVSAISAVVEVHAHCIVGIPREYDIKHLFHEVGTRQAFHDKSVPTEHLHHIINVYILGHFLLSAYLNPNDHSSKDRFSMAEKLVCKSSDIKPGKQATGELLKVYSIGSLFHDIGYLLFPHMPAKPIGADPGSQIIKKYLETVEQNLKESGTAIVNQCLKCLEQGNYFDLKKELPLKKWLNHQRESGNPDHGLLSASYLHYLSEEMRGAHKELIKKAIRAILLHNAVTVPVSIEDDPAAALLILCNEIFEWEPTGYIGSSPGAIATSLHVMASIIPPPEPRYRWISIRNSRVEMNKGKLEYIIDEHESGWPMIDYLLQKPELLDLPTYLLWIKKAQSFARLKPHPVIGWKPRLRIQGSIAPFLKERGFDSKKLLFYLSERTLPQIRPYLRRWLSEESLFKSKEPDSKTESIIISPLQYEFFQENIINWFAVMDHEAMQILKEFEIIESS